MNLRILILFFLLIVAFNNCTSVNFADESEAMKKLASKETVVGNPFASKTLLDNLCAVVTRCHPTVSVSQCETGVSNLTGIDYQLGLPTGSVSAFSTILQQESSGAFSANQSATNSCMAAVEQLSCNNSQVQAAYDSQSGSFAGVTKIIPTSPGSCPAIFNQPAARREYFVATNGSDLNDGSSAHPWATIKHAADTLVLGSEGAIVHVAPGTYSVGSSASCPVGTRPCGVITTRSGTAVAPITYISDQQGAAKIVSPGASTVWYNSGHYVRIIGFEIAGSSSSNFGLVHSASYGKLIGNHVHSIPVTGGCATGNSGAGIFFGFFSGASDNDAIGNKIHDIGPFLGNGLGASSYCSFAHGMAYHQPRGKIFNNIVYRTGTWGLFTWESAARLQISNNLFFDNGARAGDGTLVGGGVLVSAQSGVGVHDESSVSNNIFRNISGTAIVERNSVGSQNSYINNLVFSNSQNFNLISGAAPIGTISTDPLMIDFRLNGSGNYQLQSMSPAIDAGSLSCAAGSSSCTPDDDITGFARPNGSAIDIGPYEAK